MENVGHGQFFKCRRMQVILFDQSRIALACMAMLVASATLGRLVAGSPPAMPPAGMAAWWRGDGDYADVLEYSPLQPSSNAGLAPGVVRQGFTFDGLGGLSLGPSTALYLQNFTVEGWIRRASLERTTRYSGVDFIGGGGILGSGTDAWSVGMLNDGRLYLAGGVIPWPTSDIPVTDLDWHHVAVTKSGSVVQFYLDGQLAGQAEHPSDYRFEYGYVLGGMRAPDWAWECWWGALDEITVYNRPLGATEIQAIQAAGSSGKVTGDVRVRVDGVPPVSSLGAVVQARVWVEHVGDELATNVVVNYSATAGLDLSEFSASQGVVTRQGDGRSLVWDVGALAANRGAASLELKLTATRSGIQSQQVEVSYPGPDVQPTNNTLRVTTGVWLDACLQAPPGLVGWWSGEGNAEDVLGHGSGVTVGTVQYVPGFQGQAWTLGGSLDGIHLPLHPHYEVRDFTLEVWVQRTDLSPGFVNLGLLFSGNGNNFGFALSTDGAPFSSPGADYLATGAPVVNDLLWHHVAMTRSGTNLSYYVDGRPTGTARIDSEWMLQAPLAIGALGVLSGPGLYGFPGRMDELSLYDRALLESEVRQVYLAGAREKCREDIAVWAMDPPVRVLVAEESVFTFRVENRGLSQASGVTWRASWPGGLEVVAVTNSTGGASMVTSTNLISELGTLPAGAVATVDVVVRPAKTGLFKLEGLVTRLEADLADVNNAASAQFEALGLEVNAGPDILVPEEGGVATFQVWLNLPSLRTNSVLASWLPGIATPGRDYTGVVQRLTFNPGTTNQAIEASVLSDKVHELPETFLLMLSAPEGPVIVRSNATCTILDNDPLPIVSIGHATVKEGDQDSTNALFQVRLTGATEATIAIDFATTNDTAQAGADYSQLSGQIVFAPGASNRTVQIPVLGDRSKEANESFLVRLSLPAGTRLAQLTGAPGVGTILDDDAVPGEIASFEWDAIPAGTASGEWFPVTVRALDALGHPATEVATSVQFSGRSGGGRAASLVISEVNLNAPDAVELQNVTTAPLDVSGWSVIFYDATAWPAPRLTFTLPPGTQVSARGVFSITEEQRTPGTYPRYYLGQPLVWGDGETGSLLPEPRQAAVVLVDAVGVVQDVFCALGAEASQILVPRPLASGDWRGASLSEPEGFTIQTLQRWGGQNDHSSLNWTNGPVNIGSTNRNLRLPFADATSYAVESETPVVFVGGVWQGRVRLREPVAPVALVADDGRGHMGYSAVFTPKVPNDLAVSLVSDQPSFAYGLDGPLLTLTVTNPGPDLATNVVAEVAFDVNLGRIPVLSVYVSQGTFQLLPGTPAQEGRVRVQFGSLVPGSSVTAHIQMMLMPANIGGTTAPREVAIRALASSATPDAHAANNSVVVPREITSAALLLPAPPLAWWRGENDGTDVFGLHPATLDGAAGFSPGRVGGGFNLSAQEASLTVPHAPELDVGAGRDFTFETWMRLQEGTDAQVFTIAAKEGQTNAPGGPAAIGWSFWIENGKLACRISDSAIATAAAEANASTRTNDLRDGRWHHVALRVARTQPDGLELYLDGTRLAAGDPRPESGSLANEQPLRMGQHGLSSPGGELDEPAYYPRALSATDIRRMFEAGPNGKAQFKLGISPIHPEFANYVARYPGIIGQPYTLTLLVTNAGPLASTPEFTALTSTPFRMMSIRSSQGEMEILSDGPDLAIGWLGRIEAHAVATITMTLASTNSELLPVFLVGGGPLGPRAATTLALSFMPDIDGDGMWDGWEDQHGLNREQATDAGEDLDRDGMSNLQELIAGTDPTDPQSNCGITIAQIVGDRMFITLLHSQPGRFYRLEFVPPLGCELISEALEPWRAGTGSDLPLAEVELRRWPCGFYRARVLRDWEMGQ